MIGLGIIGLGTMGKMVFDAANRHPSFEVKAVFDSGQTELKTPEEQGITFATSIEALLSREDIDLIYISSPPNTHIEYCHLALDHHKALWCEKPLAIDTAKAEKLVERIEAEQAKAAVNLSLASSPAMAKMAELIEQIPVSEYCHIDMHFHYSSWPRYWQQNASGWLSSREQGGFLREVFSHFVFMHHRLLGPLQLVKRDIEYRSATSAETYINGLYHTEQLPVRVLGTIGGAAPDMNQWTLYARQQSVRFSDWNKVLVGNHTDWKPCAVEPHSSVISQLAEVAKMMAAEPHKLASFREALEVQKVVEGTLANQQVAL